MIATEGNTERINLTMTASVRLETAEAKIVEQRRFRVSSYNRTSSELANQETEASLRNTALTASPRHSVPAGRFAGRYEQPR